ncbi:MAG: SDR family NAD(P)-dependent oxidoreductase [Halioglobus sp.]
MIDYTDNTVLVTGAASGIGRALAEALSGRGARVICADKDSDGANATAEAIGRGAIAMACDLSEPDAAKKMVAKSFAERNQLDLICSNAGIGMSGKVADQAIDDDAELQALFEVNFFAGLKIAQAYHALLEEHGKRGRLMVTASENSLSVPSAVKRSRMAFYGASKHALLVALEWMRIEHEGGPLTLHALLPGAVYTNMISPLLPDPEQAPAELELIMPDECAERALRGIDEGLFYIPTQHHLLDDMAERRDAIEQALKVLNI